ncbi:uncharacterized protein PRCAT00004428001 [Priceomyces carsonii]|uniref:uncharacterized protein n=1 Tax=Priceomyces carsonii TaxID=28549 RepID=UPI002ED9D8ED|nr:unnamed protein product [Priceomyces carsonii]
MSSKPRNEILGTCITELPPCCLRISPQDNSVIVVGTYKLEEEGTRHGSIDIYKYSNDVSSNYNLKLLSKIDTESAVLDIKFHNFDPSLLALSHSTGNVVLWKFDIEQKTLDKLTNIKIGELDCLVTSVFFSPVESDRLVATTTFGNVFSIDLSDFSISRMEKAHELECWTASFGELGQLSNVVYSGGDDGKLIAHDLRTRQEIWSTSHQHHQAGVVSILSPGSGWNTHNPNQLWTGSYDDNLRILDLRLPDPETSSLIPGYVPKVIEEKNLGGGVWRLIPSPLVSDNRVLSCCMYDGARILDSKGNSIEVDKYFKGEHNSICYGGDWASNGSLVATCSFYDKVLHLWSPDEPVIYN